MSGWFFEGLQPRHYGAILADPAYAYAMRSAKGYGKSPESHYQTMPHEELRALPVGDLAAKDCLLFMWSTWPHLTQALALMDAWGFTYKTGGAWIKRTPKNNLAGFGTGFILRSATEPFLIGTIGHPETTSKSVRNVIEIEAVIDALRREHSRKPPEARDMLRELRPDVPICELFARQPWPGYDVWGNQTDRFAGSLP